MKCEFVCLTYQAVSAIINARTLQSADFDNSSIITNIANGELVEIDDSSLPVYKGANVLC